MNQKVVLIVSLVVVGAILYAATSGRKTVVVEPRPTKQWASKEEVNLVANLIVGELEEEAAEALPSDLLPNTSGLGLSDEEKTELFAILNSVTQNGVVGDDSRSERQTLLKEQDRLTKEIRTTRGQIAFMEKRLARTTKSR